MNKPGLYNINVYSGSSLNETFIWKPGGVAARLNGYGAICHWRTTKLLNPALQPALTLSTENGGISLTALEGKIHMQVPQAILTTLKEPIYYYLALLRTPSGLLRPFLEGRINLNVSVIPK